MRHPNSELAIKKFHWWHKNSINCHLRFHSYRMISLETIEFSLNMSNKNIQKNIRKQSFQEIYCNFYANNVSFGDLDFFRLKITFLFFFLLYWTRWLDVEFASRYGKTFFLTFFSLSVLNDFIEQFYRKFQKSFKWIEKVFNAF